MKGSRHAYPLDAASRQAVIEVARLMAQERPALVAVTGSHAAGIGALAALLQRNFDLEVCSIAMLSESGPTENRAIRSLLRRSAATGKAVCIVTEKEPFSPELRSLCDLVIDTDSGQVVRGARASKDRWDDLSRSPFPSTHPSDKIEKGNDPHGSRIQ